MSYLLSIRTGVLPYIDHNDKMGISKKIREIDHQRHTLLTLFYLQESGEVIFSKLHIDLKINNQTLDRVINVLKKLDLLKERSIIGSNVRLFSLTLKGIRIAEKLREIEKILEEK